MIFSDGGDGELADLVEWMFAPHGGFDPAV
jgi:hypothetical protein